jgi:ElaB/YqjD/DUF883 family membrane-anchored ribosome-binding protein
MAADMLDKLEMPATVEDVLREVSRIRTVVTDAVDDGVKSAVRAMKQGRHAAEDAIVDARRAVKQYPFEAIGVSFTAGVLTGCVVAWLARRR